MNNICNRNCHWIYNGRCYPEDGSHYENGTAYTRKCTEYLHEIRIETQMNTWSKCKDILNHCTYVQLRKAYYLLRNIDKAVIALNKQKPKKPIIKHYEDVGEQPYIKYSCPNKCRIQIVDGIDSYCCKCGQAIDWEE